MALLSTAIEDLSPSAQFFRAVSALSDAWFDRHDLQQAVDVLRSGLSRPNYAPADTGASLEATAAAFRLAKLYRVMGRDAEAAAVEADATRGLELADRGFVERLRAMASTNLPPAATLGRPR